MVSRLQQREQGGVLRGEPAGERHRARAALEVRHALLEHRGGRVHDAGVRVPVLLQVEVGRGRLRVLEHVAGSGEDGHRACARVRVGPLPGVQLPGFEAERAGFLWSAGHGGPSRKRRIIGVWRASSSRKQSWPYGASITWSSAGLPRARSAASTSRDADGGYSQSELNAISSVRAETPSSAWVSDPLPCCRARSKDVRARAIAFQATPCGCRACVLAIATTAST